MTNTLKKPLLLSAGHSVLTPGAWNKDKSLNEYEANVLQVHRFNSELKKLGKPTGDVYDPRKDNRFDIGKHAAEYEYFIEFHLNALNHIDHYSHSIVDPRFVKPTDLICLIAADFARSIAGALGLKLYQTDGWPTGIYPQTLQVLSGVYRVGSQGFLSEAFFIDAYNKEQTLSRCEIAMAAAAKAFARYIR